MHTISTSIIGIAVTDVRHTVTQSGLSLARFRMVSQPRRFDSSVGAFVDQDASFLTVFAWRAMADNVVSSIHKGDPVVVVGRLRVREWEDEGRPRVTVEVDAQSIGHDLARGSARFVRSARPGAVLAGARSEPPAVLEGAEDGITQDDGESTFTPAAAAVVPVGRAVA